MNHHTSTLTAIHPSSPPSNAVYPYQADAALLANIRETNFSYLMLVQRMLYSDREVSMRALGIDEETADCMLAMPEENLLQLASSSSLLCRLGHEYEPLLRSLPKN